MGYYRKPKQSVVKAAFGFKDYFSSTEKGTFFCSFLLI